jgi:hypothetical protein
VRRIPPAKNDDLNGPMAPLAGSQIPRVEIADGDALHRFLDWYAGSVAAPRAAATAADIDPRAFLEAFSRFQGLITARSGHPFTSFDEGLAAVWEATSRV